MRHRNQEKTLCVICGDYDWKVDMVKVGFISYAHNKCVEKKGGETQ